MHRSIIANDLLRQRQDIVDDWIAELESMAISIDLLIEGASDSWIISQDGEQYTLLLAHVRDLISDLRKLKEWEPIE